MKLWVNNLTRETEDRVLQEAVNNGPSNAKLRGKRKKIEAVSDNFIVN